MQFELDLENSGPVLAMVWVIEGGARVKRALPVLELGRLNGKVWGWCHIGKRGGK